MLECEEHIINEVYFDAAAKLTPRKIKLYRRIRTRDKCSL
jgi:hypothetical protein